MTNFFAILIVVLLGSFPFKAGIQELPEGEISTSERHVEILLFDMNAGEVLHQQGKLLTSARPMGSLLKLFTAYIALESGFSPENLFRCEPSSVDQPATQSCWYKPGHGSLDMKGALAESCNAWFRKMVLKLDLTALGIGFMRLHLLRDTAHSTHLLPDSFIGMDTQIHISPLDVIEAATALFSGKWYSINLSNNRISVLLRGGLDVDDNALIVLKAGMMEATATGTGSSLGEALGPGFGYIKTGTSPGWDYQSVAATPGNAHTDGVCVVIFPAEEPRYILFVLVPNGMGATDAVPAAAEFLSNNKVLWSKP